MHKFIALQKYQQKESKKMTSLFEVSLPYFIIPLNLLSVALLISLLQSVVNDGLSPIILVTYEHIIATIILSTLAYFFERDRRPPLNFHFLSRTFIIGFLQISGSQLLLTTSLRYISGSTQIIVLNTGPATVFLLAVITRREPFRFKSLIGQVKLLALIISTVGATILVFLSKPEESGSESGSMWWVGCLMVELAVLLGSVGSLFVERMALRYRADLTLSATMSAFGTLQILMVAGIMERDISAWQVKWTDSLQLKVILYAGIVSTGLGYLAVNWCVHKKGPVFVSAFSPLLIVFSFILQSIMFGTSISLWSIFSAVLVNCGLYLLLWAKSKEYRKEDGSNVSDISVADPLLV